MSLPSQFQASGPLPSATFSGWDATSAGSVALQREPLWAAAGSGGGGGGSAVGPANAIQFSDGAGNFQGTANGTVDSAGAIGCASVAAVGAVNAATVVASGGMTADSIAVVGAMTGANVAVTGTVTAASVGATGAVTGATVTASGAVTAASAQINGNANITGTLTTGAYSPTILTLPYAAGMGAPGAPVNIPVATTFQMVGSKLYATLNSLVGFVSITINPDPAVGPAFPLLQFVNPQDPGGGLSPVPGINYTAVAGQWRVNFNGGAPATFTIQLTYI